MTAPSQSALSTEPSAKPLALAVAGILLESEIDLIDRAVDRAFTRAGFVPEVHPSR